MNIVLLDRDGTVIVDPEDHTVKSTADIKLFDDTIASLKYFAEHDFSVIFITNQTGIALGATTEKQFWEIHEEVIRMLKPSGASILKTYLNGEANTPDASDMRKPGPGMLLQAAKDYNLDLSKIYMIGDQDTDIQAADKAGCKGGVQVKTATGAFVESPDAAYSASSLLDAAKYVVANT